jgi:hypothetical protein
MRLLKTFGGRAITHCAVLAALSAPVLLVGSQGCTLAGDYCDVYCECELCNDREADDCDVVVEAAFDLASAYDCADEADLYYECAVKDNNCDNTDFRVDDSCDDERTDYFKCVDDASDLIGGNQPPPQQQAGPGGGTTICACVCTCDTCTIPDASRVCNAGEGGCESCDVVCTDACLADSTCGGLSTVDGGGCTQG